MSTKLPIATSHDLMNINKLQLPLTNILKKEILVSYYH